MQNHFCAWRKAGPCGKCAGCLKFEHGNHLDFKILDPQNKRSISTEDISVLLGDAYLIPAEGKNKVYIIEKAHLMTAAAQNKLLKTLEEPAGISEHIAFV